VFLRKTVSGNNNLLFKLSNQKVLNSPRWVIIRNY
jgi:hypothetical protein